MAPRPAVQHLELEPALELPGPVLAVWNLAPKRYLALRTKNHRAHAEEAMFWVQRNSTASNVETVVTVLPVSPSRPHWLQGEPNLDNWPPWFRYAALKPCSKLRKGGLETYDHSGGYLVLESLCWRMCVQLAPGKFTLSQVWGSALGAYQSQPKAVARSAVEEKMPQRLAQDVPVQTPVAVHPRIHQMNPAQLAEWIRHHSTCARPNPFARIATFVLELGITGAEVLEWRSYLAQSCGGDHIVRKLFQILERGPAPEDPPTVDRHIQSMQGK